MSNRITYEYVENFINSPETGNGCLLLTPKEDYVNTHTALKIRCACGEIFETPFKKFKNRNKKQCNKCGYENISKKKKGKPMDVKFSKRKTIEQYKQEVFEKYNGEYIVLSDTYINNKTPLLHKHMICGHEYFKRPDLFLNGQRCPKCYGTPKKTHEQFCKEVYDLVGDEYSIMSEYINANTHVKIKHNVCGFEWNCQPVEFLYDNVRCPKCQKQIKVKTTEYVKHEIFKVWKDEIELIGE